MAEASTLKAQSLTLLSSFIWGSSFVVAKDGLGYMDPYYFLILRMFLAIGFNLSIVLILGKCIKGPLGHREIIFAGALNATAFICQYVGLSITTAMNASLIVELNIFFVALFSWHILKERFRKAQIFAVILATFGIILLTTNGSLENLLRGEIIGDALIGFAGMLWAGYMVIMKQYIKSGNDKAGAWSITFGINFYTTLFLIVPCFLLGSGVLVLPFHVFWEMVYLALFASVFSFLLWYVALRDISPTHSSLLLITSVVFALGLAYIFLGERLQLYGVIGAALIIYAIIIFSMKKQTSSSILSG